MDEQGISPGGVTRRRLIGTAAATAAATALPARARAATTPKATGSAGATADVVVVGAGLAGLTAARDLVGRRPVGRRARGARPRRRARAQRRSRQRGVITEGGAGVHRPHPGPHRRAGQERRGRHLPDLQHRRQHLLPQRDGHPLQLVGPARPRPARPHGSRRGREGDSPARRHGQDDPARRPVDGGEERRSGTAQTFETWKLANVGQAGSGVSCSTSPSRRCSRASPATSRLLFVLFYLAAAGRVQPGNICSSSTPAAARRSAASSAARSSCRSSSPSAWAVASSSASRCAGSHRTAR